MMKEMNVDIKLIKVLLEEIVPDVRELRKLLPEVNERSANAQELRQMRSQVSNVSRLVNSPALSQVRNNVIRKD
jgi:hypothetical protein